MFVDNNLQGVVPGLADPAIYIGVVEKGWAMLELSVQAEQKVRQCSVVRCSVPQCSLHTFGKLQ